MEPLRGCINLNSHILLLMKPLSGFTWKHFTYNMNRGAVPSIIVNYLTKKRTPEGFHYLEIILWILRSLQHLEIYSFEFPVSVVDGDFKLICIY